MRIPFFIVARVSNRYVKKLAMIRDTIYKNNCIQVKIKCTNMHSSRMRTVRCSGRPWFVGGGVSACDGGWCLPARGVCLPGGCVCPQDPPVDRMTDTCKNITLSNYVADGNKSAEVPTQSTRCSHRI